VRVNVSGRGKGAPLSLKTRKYMPASYQLNGLGTAVHEVGGSGRTFTILGAALGLPAQVLSGWADMALDQNISQLDLSSTPVDTEAILALLHLYNFDYGLTISFRWYRDRDSALIFSYDIAIPSPQSYGYGYWYYYYVYCYIGHLSFITAAGFEEIKENGAYHLNISSSDGLLNTTVPFTVTGIQYPQTQVPFTVKNTSAQAGNPVPASFLVRFSSPNGSMGLTRDFAASELRSWTAAVDSQVPFNFTVTVTSPTGIVLVNTTKLITPHY